MAFPKILMGLVIVLLTFQMANAFVISQTDRQITEIMMRIDQEAACHAYSNSSCDVCTKDSSCVWCDNGSNKTCVAGNIFGPSNAHCGDYYSSASCSVSGKDLWIIIGCSSGGGLIILLILVYCCCCRRRCCRRRHGEYEYMPLVVDNDEYASPTEGSQRRADLREKWNL